MSFISCCVPACRPLPGRSSAPVDGDDQAMLEVAVLVKEGAEGDEHAALGLVEGAEVAVAALRESGAEEVDELVVPAEGAKVAVAALRGEGAEEEDELVVLVEGANVGVAALRGEGAEEDTTNL